MRSRIFIIRSKSFKPLLPTVQGVTFTFENADDEAIISVIGHSTTPDYGIDQGSYKLGAGTIACQNYLPNYS